MRLAFALALLGLGCASQPPTYWYPLGQPRGSFEQADATCKSQHIPYQIVSPMETALAIARYQQCMNGFGYWRMTKEEARAYCHSGQMPTMRSCVGYEPD